jgi:hypothetical protein
MEQHFSVYWRAAPRQLFAYRQNVRAASPREARERLRWSMPRQSPVVVGVKALAPCGRRCAERGRWVG